MSEGSLPVGSVLGVLRAHGLSCYSQAEDPTHTVVADGHGLILAFSLGTFVSRRMVQSLSRRFGVPIHLFYNPQMLGKGLEPDD
jgi:serine/threonine protein phosphatase PrpC